jgi:type I restriction enzyme R subunit
MLFTQGDVGSREQFEVVYGKQPLGKFIRSIVGLDVEAAKTAFGSFVNSPNFNSQQIRFVDTIIQYLTVNGTIDGEAFFGPPFTDISSNGLVDVFNQELSASIINLIDVLNRNAVVA